MKTIFALVAGLALAGCSAAAEVGEVEVADGPGLEAAGHCVGGRCAEQAPEPEAPSASLAAAVGDDGDGATCVVCGDEGEPGGGGTGAPGGGGTPTCPKGYCYQNCKPIPNCVGPWPYPPARDESADERFCVDCDPEAPPGGPGPTIPVEPAAPVGAKAAAEGDDLWCMTCGDDWVPGPTIPGGGGWYALENVPPAGSGYNCTIYSNAAYCVQTGGGAGEP